MRTLSFSSLKFVIVLAFAAGLALSPASGYPAPRPAVAVAMAPAEQTALAAAFGAPALKWAYGGCEPLPWCDTGWYASPAVADLDKDGDSEVIWGGYDLVALHGADGTQQWRANSGNRIWPAIAVADINNDTILDVIVGRGGDEVTAYAFDGGVMWTRHPFGSGEVRTLAVSDLETDNQLEVIVGRGSGGNTRQLSVFEPNGSVRPGWPARHDGEPGYGWGMYNENVTVADLNNDGFKEIIGPTDTHYITALDRNGNQLAANPMYGAGKVWSQVGVHVDQAADLRGFAECGTEHRPNFANAAPAIADMDADGSLEIIVPGDVYNCDIGDPDGDMYYLPWILKLDRTRWSGGGYDWTVIPTPEPGSGPLSEDYEVIENSVTNAVIADLDGDGKKEILYSSYDGRVHAFWLDKTEHGAWPFDVPGSGIRFAGEPAVADIDNDGKAEVIFTSWPEKHDGLLGQLHVLNWQGQQLYAVNLPAPSQDQDWNGGLAAPTIANIDSDADMEIVVGTAHSGVVAYDLPNSAGTRFIWRTARGNFRRTGVLSEASYMLMSASHTSRSVAHGGSATYALKLSGNLAAQQTLTAVAPSGLTASIQPSSVTLPGTATLTVTDTHGGSLAPGQWFTVTVTAGSGTTQQTLDLRLLVDGSAVYKPLLTR